MGRADLEFAGRGGLAGFADADKKAIRLAIPVRHSTQSIFASILPCSMIISARATGWRALASALALCLFTMSFGAKLGMASYLMLGRDAARSGFVPTSDGADASSILFFPFEYNLADQKDNMLPLSPPLSFAISDGQVRIFLTFSLVWSYSRFLSCNSWCIFYLLLPIVL